MKTKIVYGAVFGSAFIIVSAMIIFFNSLYRNIFHFDFTPVNSVQVIHQANVTGLTIADVDKLYGKKLKKDLLDSIRAYSSQPEYDSNTVVATLDSTFHDSLNVFRKKLTELEKKNYDDAVKRQKDDSLKVVKEDKKLIEWATQTAKLYETMDPKKAAKIIAGYSDNESREILFRMNKKKAAKILSELKPETANRITKAL